MPSILFEKSKGVEPIGKKPAYGAIANRELIEQRGWNNINNALEMPPTQTEEGKQWEGWGTALKPAMELWTLVRKPLEQKTVAENVLKYGTGGMNIDGCRVGTEIMVNQSASSIYSQGQVKKDKQEPTVSTGRFPANLIHDGSEEVVELFPTSKSTLDKSEINRGTSKSWFTGDHVDRIQRGDSGSAARFFYCAKASKSERNKGLEGFEEKENMRVNAPRENEEEKTSNKMSNFHPTVKPVALMRYLCRLITPKNGIVLDPFMGSGTTGIGAKIEGFEFIGIEREAEYVKIAEARINAYGVSLGI